MSLNINRRTIDSYSLDYRGLSESGSDYFLDHTNARSTSHSINTNVLYKEKYQEQIKPSTLSTMGLYIAAIEEMIGGYCSTDDNQLPVNAYQHVNNNIGEKELHPIISLYLKEFANNLPKADQFLFGDSKGNNENISTLILTRIFILWLVNQNPSFKPKELFDDRLLNRRYNYQICIRHLRNFFDAELQGEDENLIDILLKPSILHPNNLQKQLEYMLKNWKYLKSDLTIRLLRSMDFINEDLEKIFGPGPGPIQIPDFSYDSNLLPNKYSRDEDWMSNLVLIAKNTYVWLDQLRKQYKRNINKLDQIPDEELDLLAERGITGLWLIGIWERSQASAKIKQICGNPEALSSAYSISRYEIANNLGGMQAYQNLKERAMKRGIRVGCDMVPNHTSIDSDWVSQHPDWFIALPESPYPTYSFNGFNLSNYNGVEVYLEDHYYDKTDAAVVFKRVETDSGQASYIYHGNDGTSMPWNDTAQLNYLTSDVREAIINKIVSIAKEFPIIRFDAAMTLTKKHFQRLWFPEPGKGGDIPTRSEHGMGLAEFNKLMPQEFWIEVVDRVAKEAPDTLLLAEAFWMMESYFVRNLGMHRVYNSAFMNLLRDEDNARFRELLKKSLEFDPQIVKRYVNFMNNPDERTAVDQFGKGDKYFGICTLLATLPGLPMIGHGQFEGYTEKYGMEYSKAYLDETPDPNLIDQHRRKIVPLLKNRYEFSGIENFYMYDFYTQDGVVDEDVIAFSNGMNDRTNIVIYNNKYQETTGVIQTTCKYSHKKGQNKEIINRRLNDFLSISPVKNEYIIFKDRLTDLEYIRNAEEIYYRGLEVHLHGYQHFVFSDFRKMYDDKNLLSNLNIKLKRNGVPSIENATNRIKIDSLYDEFNKILDTKILKIISDIIVDKESVYKIPGFLSEIKNRYSKILDCIVYYWGYSNNYDEIICDFVEDVDLLDTLNQFYIKNNRSTHDNHKSFLSKQTDQLLLFYWILTHNLGKLISDTNQYSQYSVTWLKAWELSSFFNVALLKSGIDDNTSKELLAILPILIDQEDWYCLKDDFVLGDIVKIWMENDIVKEYLMINVYDNVTWFNKERYVSFIRWMKILAIIDIKKQGLTAAATINQIKVLHTIFDKLQFVLENSEYKLEKLFSLLNGD